MAPKVHAIDPPRGPASVLVQVGYDLEMGILTAFAGLWAMPEYEKYVEGDD